MTMSEFLEDSMWGNFHERQWIKFARYTQLDNCIGKAQQTVRQYQSPEGMVIEMKLTMDGMEYRGRLVQVKEDEEE
jgi:hypothetical protein